MNNSNDKNNEDIYINEKALQLIKAMAEWKKCETNPIDNLFFDNAKFEVQNAFMAVSAHYDDMNIETKMQLTTALIDFNDAFDELVNVVTAIQEVYKFEVD